MALSLRDKLAQAAKANLLENASKTCARLEHMEGASRVSAFPARELRTDELDGAVEPVSSRGKAKGLDEGGGQAGDLTGAVEPVGSPGEKWTVQMDGPNGRSKRTDTVDGPNGQSKRTVQMDSPYGQSKWTVQMDGPPRIGAVPNAGHPALNSRQQRRMLAFLQERRRVVANIDMLSKMLDIPDATTRKILRVLAQRGLIQKRKQGNDGLVIEVVSGVGTVQMDGPNGQSKWTVQMDGPSSSLKRDRERKDLSLSYSEDLMALNWPTLVAAGFGPEQVRQVAEALAAAGRDAGQVRAGLDRAEWELAQGAMTDKAGQPVADPAAWVFRSLARTGTYRRPKGYISPEEQAARDAAAEAAAVIEAVRQADAARFAAWKLGLEGEELDAAMRGFPGGSRDRWLRTVWEKRRTEYPVGRE